jgi:hypothetical protein
MTLETRTTIELGDIRAIEFECAACHARTAIPIEKFNQPPTRCSSCDSKQWLVMGSQDWEDIRRFVGAIRFFSNRAPETFAIRIEITNVSASGHAVGGRA